MLRGRIEFPRLTSALLPGNPLGDPIEREVLVYLPPSYAASRERRYPTLTILPAYAAGHRSLNNYRCWESGVFEQYEALLRAGAVPEAILWSPDCMTSLGGSQFLDSEATGPYQSYVVDEVLPFVEASYRSLATRRARAVAGHSSGGFGALRLGLDRPDVFAAYGSHAGDCAFDVSVRPTFTEAAVALGAAGGVEAFLTRIEERGPRGPGDFMGIMTLATAAAYAPNPDSPSSHGALPFELHTGRVDQEVWARWLAHDPCVRLDRDPEALKTATLVYLDAGDRDEHGLQLGARRLAASLGARGVNLVHEEFPGGHRGTSYRWSTSLPHLLGALDT